MQKFTRTKQRKLWEERLQMNRERILMTIKLLEEALNSLKKSEASEDYMRGELLDIAQSLIFVIDYMQNDKQI